MSEVAIREQGTVTAIETDHADGDVVVDLDHQPPRVGVPDGFAVQYEPELDGDDHPDAAPDGGHLRNRVALRQYGLGLTDEPRTWAIAITALAFVVAGYLGAIGEGASGLVVGLAASVLGYLLFLYRRGGES